MPDAGFTPFTNPEIVANYLQPVLERLAMTFSLACGSTRQTFVERKWSDDGALAAYLVRKEVLESLRTDGMQVEEEDVEVERKALCGLMLNLPLVHLKIRKSKDGEIPAAGSKQSLSFYNWNLLVFPQTENGEIPPLHLLLLWNDNRKGELETLLLVCVEGNEWRWRVPVFQRNAKANSNYTSAAYRESPQNTSNLGHFTSAFDEANQDVPLTLAEVVTPSGPVEEEGLQKERREQVEQQKKKAK